VEHTAEHAIPSVEESFTLSWRTVALVIGAIAAVELVLLVVAGVALLGRSSSHSAAAAPAKPAAPAKAKKKPAAHPPPPAAKTKHAPAKKPAPATTLPPRSKLPVLVLNGNGQTGAAGTEAAVVRARGYPVTSVGNARRTDYGPSMVMYRPGYRAAAQRFAKDIAVKIVAPLDGLKASDLGTAKLAVVVGRN
jgi:uncharacterized iron-regulated membrane protein